MTREQLFQGFPEIGGRDLGSDALPIAKPTLSIQEEDLGCAARIEELRNLAVAVTV